MKKWLAFAVLFLTAVAEAAAQCAMCTKTAQQLGEGPAKGMNAGIIYLMILPFAIAGFIGYRWWKSRDVS